MKPDGARRDHTPSTPSRPVPDTPPRHRFKAAVRRDSDRVDAGLGAAGVDRRRPPPRRVRCAARAVVTSAPQAFCSPSRTKRLPGSRRGSGQRFASGPAASSGAATHQTSSVVARSERAFAHRAHARLLRSRRGHAGVERSSGGGRARPTVVIRALVRSRGVEAAPSPDATRDRFQGRACRPAGDRVWAGGHLRRRPGWLREDDVAGAVGRTQGPEGGMGQRRRPRQRPCRPPHLRRSGIGPRRGDRPERVSCARLLRRRHRGSAAAGRRDGQDECARSRSSSTTSKWSRTRRVSTRLPGWRWGCRRVRSSRSVRGTCCRCRRRGYARRAASWRSGSTIWRWTRMRRARCCWRRVSSSTARTSMISSAGPKAGRSACTSLRWR